MMNNADVTYKVGVAEIRQITDLLKTKHSFDFSKYALSSFQRRIIRVLTKYKMENVQELIIRINTDVNFVEDFVEEITVNTTEMFRSPSMWVELKDFIKKRLEKKEKIKIWHAGCSSGEEVYSMAILLKELGVYSMATIYASDLSDTVIQTAKSGVYPKRNMELNGANYKRAKGNYSLENYYTLEGNNAKMDRQLLANVTFKKHNLAQDDSFGQFDFIICRNVLIYFDKVLQDEVFKLFHKSLKVNSLMVIGSKETMIWSSIKNKFNVLSNKEKIYQVVAS